MKLRHRLRSPPGVMLAIDEFQGELHGLVNIEAEFDMTELMVAFNRPDFAIREVTDDIRYTGGYLAKNGFSENR